LKALQAHVDHVNLLMREIRHRSKNMLGLVQAIAGETAATGKPEDFMRRLTERVEALYNQSRVAGTERMAGS
jgi:two-component sensor histidine kinase